MTTYDPNHESTHKAWQAVTPKRADDLIRSAIKHGHLEERRGPLGANHTTQVRLPDSDGPR